MIRSFPSYIAMRALWNARVGNPDDPADQESLINASPLFAADRIRIPLLIALGANDSRVKQSEAEQIVAASKRTAALPRTYCTPMRATASLAPRTGWIFWRARKSF